MKASINYYVAMNIGILLDKTLDQYQINAIEMILQNPAFNIKLAVINDNSGKIGRDFLRKKLNKDIGQTYSSNEFFREVDIDILTTSKPGSPKNISIIRSYSPDVLILLDGFKSINKTLLDLTSFGVISYHFGDLRKYRGEPPAFWELYNGKSEMVVTVQKLTERCSCGLPVLEKKVEITYYDDVKSLREKAFRASEEMMLKALYKIQDKTFKPETIKLYGRIYNIPSLKEYSSLLYRLASKKIQHKAQEVIKSKTKEPNYI